MVLHSMEQVLKNNNTVGVVRNYMEHYYSSNNCCDNNGLQDTRHIVLLHNHLRTSN